MKLRPDCLPCILHQALQVARAASEDEWSQRKVLAKVLGALPDADWENTPADLLEDALEATRDTLKVSDPYSDHRQKVQTRLATLAATFADGQADAEDRVARAILGAAAANMVDELVFLRFSKADLAAVFDEALAAGLAVGSLDQLREAIDAASSVLYILDNAGEVHFDAILIGELRSLGKQVRVAVRGAGSCTTRPSRTPSRRAWGPTARSRSRRSSLPKRPRRPPSRPRPPRPRGGRRVHPPTWSSSRPAAWPSPAAAS